MTNHPQNLMPHHCPACGGWKVEADDYCRECINYQIRAIEEKEAKEKLERAQKRTLYFMDKL